MPRNGSGVMSWPVGTTVTSGTTIESAPYNAFLADLLSDLNAARPVSAGGTGATTESAARTALGLAIGSDVQAFGAVLDDFNTLGAAASDGEIIVATGAGAFAYESGATLRTSIGVGTGDTPQLTGLEVGHATDTTLARASAGVLSVEGNHIPCIGSQAAGDIIYHNGTTWARLAKGTASQILQMNSGATAPEWTTGSGGLVFLGSIDLSSTASADFGANASPGITLDGSAYDAFIFYLMNVVPATDNVELLMRTSTDGGTSYDSGAGNYGYAQTRIGTGGNNNNSAASATSIALTEAGVGSAAGEDGVSGQVIVSGGHLAKTTNVTYSIFYEDDGGNLNWTSGGGQRKDSSATNGYRFLFDSGNMESGTITVVGVKNS